MAMTTTEYFKTIPLAERIRQSLFGEPKTHQQWADSFNIRGKIINAIHESELKAK